MGAIQGLRSESLALRAKEDTNLQISSHVAGVNKSLGSQVQNLIDGLQSVIAERTKAYNGLVGKINQSVNGKGGVGDRGVQWAFQAVNALITAVGVVQGLPTSASKVGTIVSTFTDLAATISGAVGINFSLASAVHDYEKMMSQLGMSEKAETYSSGDFNHSGATKLLDLRDSMMPRYKIKDGNWGPGATSPTNNPSGNNLGYIGTLRRN